MVVDQKFISRLKQLQSVCAEFDLSSVHTVGSPEAWGPGNVQDDLRLTMPELVVGNGAFWFNDYPKHASYQIETNSIGIDNLVEMVAIESNERLYFGDDTDELKEIVEDEIADSLKLATEMAKNNSPYMLRVMDGRQEYYGKVLGVTELHVVQSIGRLEAIIHEKKNIDREPKIGEMIAVIYNGKGRAVVTGYEKDTSLSR